MRKIILFVLLLSSMPLFSKEIIFEDKILHIAENKGYVAVISGDSKAKFFYATVLNSNGEEIFYKRIRSTSYRKLLLLYADTEYRKLVIISEGSQDSFYSSYDSLYCYNINNSKLEWIATGFAEDYAVSPDNNFILPSAPAVGLRFNLSLIKTSNGKKKEIVPHQYFELKPVQKLGIYRAKFYGENKLALLCVFTEKEWEPRKIRSINEKFYSFRQQQSLNRDAFEKEEIDISEYNAMQEYLYNKIDSVYTFFENNYGSYDWNKIINNYGNFGLAKMVIYDYSIQKIEKEKILFHLHDEQACIYRRNNDLHIDPENNFYIKTCKYIAPGYFEYYLTKFDINLDPIWEFRIQDQHKILFVKKEEFAIVEDGSFFKWKINLISSKKEIIKRYLKYNYRAIDNPINPKLIFDYKKNSIIIK